VAYRVRPHRDHHRNHRSGVLGDVAGHLLGRQLALLVVVAGDVADVELLTPAGIAARLVIEARTGNADGRDRQAQGLLEQGGRERLGGWGQAARAAALGGRVRRMTTWKWMAPRRWNSATLA
jgi:hypothetical protein